MLALSTSADLRQVPFAQPLLRLVQHFQYFFERRTVALPMLPVKADIRKTLFVVFYYVFGGYLHPCPSARVYAVRLAAYDHVWIEAAELLL
jgi:hypothetical protein